MVASAHTESQGRAWPQRQEEKWQTLATNKMDQLDSLFEDHLRWFRQHKTATSLIATRRTLTNDDTTDIGRTKRTRFDDNTQSQSDPQQIELDSETKSKPHHISVNATATTTFDDNALDTPTQDSQPPTARDTTNDVSPDTIEQESTQSPPQPPTKISREYLLRHFEQEEQKYGRYGLRNRSLGSTLATTSSSKQGTSSADIPEQQRRKTIDNHGTLSAKPTDEDTTKETAVPAVPVAMDNIIPPVPTTSLPSDITQTTSLPNQQLNTPTPKGQRPRTYGQEEQFDDEVLLLSRPSNHIPSSAAALNDGPSRLDQHNGLGGANNSWHAREGYSFSSIFSFNRASSSALEPSVHHDDPNISNISNISSSSSSSSSSKTYTPKRPTDSYHTRPSRLTHASPSTPSKSKTSSSTPSSSPGPTIKIQGHTNASSTTSVLPRNQSYTPGKPWNATPVSTSFLSSSTIYSNTSLKRDSSRHINNSESSSHKKSSKDNSEMKQDQEVIEGSDKANEPQQVDDATTDDSSQPTAVIIPSWASHPELDRLLREQIKLDADKIFGKMPPLQVSEIVKMDGY